jgi:hypothetical protein
MFHALGRARRRAGKNTTPHPQTLPPLFTTTPRFAMLWIETTTIPFSHFKYLENLYLLMLASGKDTACVGTGAYAIMHGQPREPTCVKTKT